MQKRVLIGNCKECMFHFLRESLAFWSLAAGVSLSEDSWLFIEGGLDGKHAVGSWLCAAGVGDDARLCHGHMDLCSFASLNFFPKLCIQKHNFSSSVLEG